MSTNIDQTNKKSLFSVSGLLARTLIYSGVCMGIIASFYDFQLNSFVVSGTKYHSQSTQYINSINKAQEAYYRKYGKFSDSIEELRIKNQKNRDYTYEILSSIGPFQSDQNQHKAPQFENSIAIAIATYPNRGHKSYTGGVFVFINKVSHQLTTKSAICESDRVNRIPPTFDGVQIHCPPGTNILYQFYK